MKKNFSINEFKKYCDDNNIHSITYISENQAWYRITDPCSINMCFSVILINENPNIICLKSGSNILQFDLVKFVEIDTKSSMSGTTILLHCGFHPSKKDIIYTLIAK